MLSKLGPLAAILGWAGLAVGTAAAGHPAPSPQGPAPGAALTLGDLVKLDRAALDQLYDQANPGAIPSGRVRGRVVGMRGGRLSSGATRLVWQGKVFREGEGQAVNRFFGLPVVRANVGYGPSWRDGRPSIILDYEDTSRVYARYRDEVREVAPGLYLGLMYARTDADPRLAMYFAIEDPSARR